MSKHIIVYLKVQQTKEGELKFEGPVLGPVTESLEQAEEEAKKIVSSMPRMAIIPKIYEMEGDQEPLDILEEVEKHFDILRDNISESKEIMDKPIHRSKKKKNK